MFQKAIKQESKLRLAIAGPSGSGKTYTALAIAKDIAGDGRVAVVDTEHGSASKYADIFDFDVAEMHAPFSPDKYTMSINAAAQAGYKVIVLDSMSHAWSGEGGLLEIVDGIAKRMKSSNTYAAWKEATPIQNRMVEAMLAAPIHIIATVRSKQDYSMERDERTGKTSIRKVGMAPVQRDGFEYEFDVFFDMDIDNNAIVSKTRCPALTGRVFGKPGADVAQILNDWLIGGGAPTPQPQPQPVQNGNGHDEDARYADVDVTVDMSAIPEDTAGHLATPQPNGNGRTNDYATMFADESIAFSEAATGMITKLREAARNSNKPMTAKQYGFLCSLVDGVAGDNMHGAVLSCVLGTDISSDNMPGMGAKVLIDWLKSDNEATLAKTKAAVGEIAAKCRELA